MFQHKTKDLTEDYKAGLDKPKSKSASIFAYKTRLAHNHPSLIHFSSTPLFRLEKDPEKYVHLLKKKDSEHIGPIVNYLIRNSGQVAYLGGEAVNNLFLYGRKKYKNLNVLAILNSREEVDKYAGIMNNIISSNDGAFSIQLRYRIRKNRCEGCFGKIAEARYIIEPRLEGFEKLLYPLRSSTIELDITTQQKFFDAYGIEESFSS